MEHTKDNCTAYDQILAATCGLMCANCGACKCGKCKMITRKQYMNGEYSHAEYYAQFVTDQTKKDIIRSIGIDTLLASKDQHLNDIPLHKWDNVGISMSFNRGLLKEADPMFSGTLSNLVCIAKEAARQVVAENQAWKGAQRFHGVRG